VEQIDIVLFEINHGLLQPENRRENSRSSRIVKEPGNNPGDDSGAAGGSNVRRKEVSPFNDLTMSDMFKNKRNTAIHATRTTI
jgi:hypothetical protein